MPASLVAAAGACDYECAGRSCPCAICDPLAAARPLARVHDHAGVERSEAAHGRGSHAACRSTPWRANCATVSRLRSFLVVASAVWSSLGEPPRWQAVDPWRDRRFSCRGASISSRLTSDGRSGARWQPARAEERISLSTTGVGACAPDPPRGAIAALEPPARRAASALGLETLSDDQGSDAASAAGDCASPFSALCGFRFLHEGMEALSAWSRFSPTDWSRQATT